MKFDDTDDIDIDDLDAHQEADSSVDEDLIPLDADDDPEQAAADENLNDEDEDQDPSEEDDSDDEEDEEDADAGKSHRNSKVEKRISKEVARRKAAEDKLTQQDTEIKTLRDKLAESSKSGKVFASLEEVDATKTKLLAEMDTIEDAIDEGGYETADGKTIDVPTLKKWRRAIREELTQALPAAERRLVRQEEINREQVSRIYPDLLNSKSDISREASRLFDRVPGLRSDPEAFLLVGDLLRGRSLRMKISGKGHKDRRPPPPESRTPSAARSVRNPKAGGDNLLGEISTILNNR